MSKEHGRGSEPILILGAGLSGLSLACALLDHGVRQDIRVLDRREGWAKRDRTWCTWDTHPGLRFLELADHRWPAWTTVAHGRTALARAPATPYVHIPAERLYAAALEQLDAASNVRLETSTTVLEIEPDPRRPRVRTDTELIEADLVFDALGTGSPLLRGRPSGTVEVSQRFLGWEIETDAAAFDPELATLMDFRPASEEEARFVYVLPFAPGRALVEDTSIGISRVTPAQRREALREELAGLPGYDVVREERGSLPMTTFSFPAHPGPRVHAVGTAAGGIRPSSGYAFTRIQLHVDAVARAFADGEPLPARLGGARLDVLDTVFLNALALDASRFPEVFLRLAERVSGETFARFMTDAATREDELAVILAQPKGLFLAAAARAGLAAQMRAITRRAG